jgi:hypothetical protein
VNALEFLAFFPGDTCYAVIDDKRQDQNPIHYHEGYDKTREHIHSALSMKNRGKSGHGIFFCVNEIDRRLSPKKQRTSAMVINCRAVFIDDDEPRSSPRDDFALKPSLIVQSSPGKYHYYWLTATRNFEEWERVMNRLVVTERGDPQARDLVRVMRVPGFKHLKREAFLTTIVGGNKQKYDWDIIRSTWEPTDDVPMRSVTRDGVVRTISVNTVSGARDLVKNGENFHEALRYLGLRYVNKGLDREELTSFLQDLLETCEVKDDRWAQRCAQLDTNVKDWFQFVDDNPLQENIQVETVEITERQVELKWPPGIMGDLCREIYEMAHHPNQELAIMAGFTLIAGVVGRTFNVNGSGLNLYIACLGRTGIGKSIIKDSINKALREVGILNNGASFIGPARITGPKALLKALHEHPTKLLVMEESGLLSQSRAGDTAGINRVLLELFTSSGKDQWFGAEAYSDSKESSAALRAPSLTIAHVSTPESYIEALRAKDSTNSGDLARIWTLRTLRDKSYLNRDRRTDFSSDVAKRIKEVISICKGNQNPENKEKPVVIDMDTDTIDLVALDRIWTDKENRLIHIDPLKATIASRAVLKILKIAGAASVFNDTGGKIGLEEYKWALHAVEEEFNTINLAVKMNDSTDMDAVIEFYAIPYITKILNGGYKNPNCRVSVAVKGKGIFAKSHLHAASKNNSTIKKMASDIKGSFKATSGTDKILDAMISAGYIYKLTQDECRRLTARGKVGQLYVITEMFKVMASGG